VRARRGGGEEGVALRDEQFSVEGSVALDMIPLSWARHQRELLFRFSVFFRIWLCSFAAQPSTLVQYTSTQPCKRFWPLAAQDQWEPIVDAVPPPPPDDFPLLVTVWFGNQGVPFGGVYTVLAETQRDSKVYCVQWAEEEL